MFYINSVGGFRGMPYNSTYTASKMAQFALAQALQIELKDDGIHVGVVFVGFTENDPDKKILDVDGSWIYLPKRENIHLAKPQSVAKSVCELIEKRQFQITLTPLGHLTEFLNRYFPDLTSWIINLNRKKIKDEFTLIGGERVKDSLVVDRVKQSKVIV
ncbi:MAG: SDR family NAD(P)-dependent oxidoreductase [Saprospiraceae bacterium]|nr:SDR family NAD(P)-dependent oxidoreductase [Saprospiraceae bacterium]